MKIYVLTAEHFHVPGLIVETHANYASAVDSAVELANVMLADNGDKDRTGAGNWEDAIERLQDEHGAAHCYIEIAEKQLLNRAT